MERKDLSGLAPHHKRVRKALGCQPLGWLLRAAPSPSQHLKAPIYPLDHLHKALRDYWQYAHLTLNGVIQCRVLSFWFCRNHKMRALERTSYIIYFRVFKFVADVWPLPFLHPGKTSLIGDSILYFCAFWILLNIILYATITETSFSVLSHVQNLPIIVGKIKKDGIWYVCGLYLSTLKWVIWQF